MKRRNSLRAIVVDDDPIVLKSMSILCTKSNDVDLVNTFSSGIDALEFLKTNEIELIFIDLDMPVLNGWDVLELLPYKPHIIVVSSRREQAFKGFRFDVFDFLPKPVSVGTFLKVIERLNQFDKTGNPTDHFYVKIDHEHVKVRFADILFVKALGDYVQIQLVNQKLTVHSTLKAIASELQAEAFFQTHRSFIVALDKIDRVLKDDVQIASFEVPVSAAKLPLLKKTLNLN